MGYYTGYALSLFGREQDLPSHVLVSEPFDAAPDFWYPPPQARMVRMRGKPPGQDEISKATAEVSLALNPFLRSDLQALLGRAQGAGRKCGAPQGQVSRVLVRSASI